MISNVRPGNACCTNWTFWWTLKAKLTYVEYCGQPSRTVSVGTSALSCVTWNSSSQRRNVISKRYNKKGESTRVVFAESLPVRFCCFNLDYLASWIEVGPRKQCYPWVVLVAFDYLKKSRFLHLLLYFYFAYTVNQSLTKMQIDLFVS